MKLRLREQKDLAKLMMVTFEPLAVWIPGIQYLTAVAVQLQHEHGAMLQITEMQGRLKQFNIICLALFSNACHLYKMLALHEACSVLMRMLSAPI